MIKFKKVRIKNFLSYGNHFTEMELDKNRTSIIVGKNGCGKSTFLDAICYALYGKPYRNIKKPQLVNTINNKDMVVELEFTLNGSDYMVRRGTKPNIFEVYRNNNMIDQDATIKDYQEQFIRNILKINEKTFRNIIALGSANYIPFMDLKARDRRLFIEELLDINIFSTMNILAKGEFSAVRNELQQKERDLSLLKEKINVHTEYLAKLQKNKSDDIDSVNGKIEETKEKTKTINEKIDKFISDIEALKGKIGKKSKVEDQVSRIRSIRTTMNKRIKEKRQFIEFFDEHKTCPTCQQGIAASHKESIVKKTSDEIAELNERYILLEQKSNKTDAAMKQVQAQSDELSVLSRQLSASNSELKSNMTRLQELEEELIELQSTEEETQTHDELVKYNAQLELISDQVDECRINMEYFSFIIQLLKDTGIKSMVIQKYLPAINKLVNMYLNKLEFYVQFELDENFNEVIRSRYRDEFSYNSFSEGEKFRINIALLLTWREIAKMKNSASTSLMFLDEVFDSSLDEYGVDDFIRLIYEMDKDINIFVISHKGDSLHDKFDNIINIEKSGNFSTVR